MPVALGIESRVPGFEPYLQFVTLDVVFLRFGSRAYKDPTERVRTRSGTPVPVALGIESRVPGFEVPAVCDGCGVPEVCSRAYTTSH